MKITIFLLSFFVFIFGFSSGYNFFNLRDKYLISEITQAIKNKTEKEVEDQYCKEHYGKDTMIVQDHIKKELYTKNIIKVINNSSDIREKWILYNVLFGENRLYQYRGEKNYFLRNVDFGSFKILNWAYGIESYYSADKKNLYFHRKFFAPNIISGGNNNVFAYTGNGLTSRIAKSDYSVYFNGVEVYGINRSEFAFVGEIGETQSYFKDGKNIYMIFECGSHCSFHPCATGRDICLHSITCMKILSGADVNTFIVEDNELFEAYDKNGVYHTGIFIPRTNKNNLNGLSEMLQEQKSIQEQQAIQEQKSIQEAGIKFNCTTETMSENKENLTMIDDTNGFATDGMYIYRKSNCAFIKTSIKKADFKLHLLQDGVPFSVDTADFRLGNVNNKIYRFGEDGYGELKDSVASEFTYIGDWYFKSNGKVWFKNSLLERADYNTFNISYGFGWYDAFDKYSLYLDGKIVGKR